MNKLAEKAIITSHEEVLTKNAYESDFEKISSQITADKELLAEHEKDIDNIFYLLRTNISDLREQITNSKQQIKTLETTVNRLYRENIFLISAVGILAIILIFVLLRVI